MLIWYTVGTIPRAQKPTKLNATQEPEFLELKAGLGSWEEFQEVSMERGSFLSYNLYISGNRW